MSSTRVVVGTDERGRPLSEWRTTPGDDGEPRYGFMEPAHASPIERRQATPAELAAARAREEEPRHLVAPTLAKPVVFSPIQRATPAPVTTPEEEPHVSSEPPANIPEIIPGHDGTALDRLVQAASLAAETHEREQAADTAWELSREALARAYAEVEGIVEPLPPQPDDDHVHYALTIPITPTNGTSNTVAPQPILPTVRTRVGEGQRPGQKRAREQRAVEVMSAMARNGDDMGAVATELGMKKNAVAQVVKHARLRAEAVQA